MKKSITLHRLLGLVTALLLMLCCILTAFPQMQAEAASVDYPAVLIRISTADNARNLNITGTADKSPLNTWTMGGEQNENWRFDLVGSDANGTYFKIVNQGSGRLLTPMGYEVTEGTEAVLFGSESAKEQHWYVIPVSQDKYGSDLYYKIVNYADTNMALTYNASANTVTLNKYTGAESQKWLLNAAGLQGFGGYAKDMSGSVKASTIGGLFGKVIEVSTFDELKAACTSTEPATVVITKNISASGTYKKDSNGRYQLADGIIYMQPNKTIVGSYGANTVYNVYFRTYNENYGPGHNIIFRNLTVTHDKELNNDNIMEFSYGWNYWIDHITYVGHDDFNTASTGLDDWDKFLNFKIDSNLITISDCQFGKHEYGVLLGYPTDDEATYNKYNGLPLVTLANNYYKETLTRAPALCRYGYFHSLNNYVYNFSMGYTVHTACKIYAENCYYEKGGNVICDWNQITFPGAYAEDGSVFVNVNRTVQGQGTSSNPSYSVACTWRPTANYTYSELDANAAKTYAQTYSGAQASRDKYTYATLAKVGWPSAGYVEAPATTMEPEVIEPISGNLVKDLIVTDATRKSWGLDTDIQVGDKVFGDRDVTWASLPAQLVGEEMILTACDAKASSGDSLATFTAGADMTVYIGLDARVTAVPAWMASYENAGLTALNSADVTFLLYAKSVRAGETVTLGAQGQSAGCVNYTVFAAVPKADVTADGAFNTLDIVAVQKYLVNLGTLANAEAGDVNGDGALNIFDLALMKHMLLGAAQPAVQPTDPTEPTAEPTTEAKSAYEPDGFTFSGKVILVGDSTVCEYDSNTSTSLDRYGWGMKLGEQYSGVTVNNLALSGRSSRSFLTEQNYQTLKSTIGKGDYLFIQFGHNDEKTDEATYPGLGTYPGLDWSTLDQSGQDSQGRYSYEYILTAYYINLAKNAGAVPVLVTPITRRGSDGTPYYQAHTEYQNGMIGHGKMYNVPVIDATTLTTELYNSVGAANTAAFHCYTDAAHTTIDNTHLSSKGASTIAGIIAQQTKELGLTIGNYVILISHQAIEIA